MYGKTSPSSSDTKLGQKDVLLIVLYQCWAFSTTAVMEVLVTPAAAAGAEDERHQGGEDAKKGSYDDVLKLVGTEREQFVEMMRKRTGGGKTTSKK